MSASKYPHKHHRDLQTLTVPFQVPSRGSCVLTATIQPMLDPVAYGQGLLGLWTDPKIVTGFPIMQATISPDLSSPADAHHVLASKGYATLYGWVQMHTPEDGTDSDGSRTWVMDLYPPLGDLNTPFTIWGSHPTTIDCPGRDTTKVPELDWSARTWVAYSPDACMSKTVVPVTGFEWGFWDEEGKVYVKELIKLDVKTWEDHLGLLRGNFGGWTFEDSNYK